jgi:DNA-binding NarL/FixJ family response regulator
MHHILIIEDDSAILTNMELILRMEGFLVSSAGDGTTGLAKLQTDSFDLILCDIMMPGLSGFALLEQLKEDPACADTPFIFVTALDDRTSIRRGMTAGADDYLPKPFSADELVAAVTGRLHRLEIIRQSSAKAAFKDELTTLRQATSEREREVLLMVGRGATSRDIAGKLGISLRTVEVHRSNLMKKLDAANAAILARWAVIAEQL